MKLPWQRVVIYCAIGAFLLINFLFPRIDVTSGDMSPTIRCIATVKTNGRKARPFVTYVSDSSVVNRLAYIFAPPQRGDIVAFVDFSAHRAPVRLLRVAGLPTETVGISNGITYINGVEATNFRAASDEANTNTTIIRLARRRLPENIALLERFKNRYDATSKATNGAWGLAAYRSDCMPRYALGKSEYFLLGDNFDNAVDSRAFGAVRTGAIIGKVVSIQRRIR